MYMCPLKSEFISSIWKNNLLWYLWGTRVYPAFEYFSIMGVLFVSVIPPTSGFLFLSLIIFITPVSKIFSREEVLLANITNMAAYNRSNKYRSMLGHANTHNLSFELRILLVSIFSYMAFL